MQGDQVESFILEPVEHLYDYGLCQSFPTPGRDYTRLADPANRDYPTFKIPHTRGVIYIILHSF